jgi:hypothetical protein
MTIVLRDVTKENWQECLRLKLAPEQEHFVASNVYSLAESKFMPTFIPQAIYARDVAGDATASERLVGFVMYGYYPMAKPVRPPSLDLPANDRSRAARARLRCGGPAHGPRPLEVDPACPDVLIGYERTTSWPRNSTVASASRVRHRAWARRSCGARRPRLSERGSCRSLA